jgi:proline iminopeptidase
MRITVILFAFAITMSALAQQPVAFKTDDGETLYYVRSGSGPRVIFLCGGPGYAAALMNPWLDTLANQFESVLFEQRGTGLSKGARLDSTTVNLRRACQDLENLRVHLGDNLVTLCGYSWGAMLGLAYAGQYPSHVRNLVLLAPGPIDRQTMRASFDNARRDMYPSERDSVAYWSNPQIRASDSVRADRLQSVFSLMCRFYDHSFGRKVLEDYLRHGDFNSVMSDLMWKDLDKGFDLANAARSYKNRCSIIRPRQDNIPEEVLLRIKESVPQALISYIERCGHLADLERPKVLFHLLRLALAPTDQ